VKRILFFLILILTVPLTGCSGQEVTVDMNKTVTDTNAPPVNLSAEIARAKKENKLLLLEFGSSDSCPPCVLMEQKVFSTPQFQAYAKSNLDFVRLDFPIKSNLRPDTSATNGLLSQQFDVTGFPTFFALDRNGKVFWAQEGVDAPQFEPANFISLLEQVKQKEK
jgi:thioredoxin-related protein